MMPEAVDVAVIGAGILGCMVARELSRYRLDVAVLERARDLGVGSTKANSGLLHAGFHARGGSLKGRSCVEGNALYTDLCAELDVPMQRVGSLFVAFHAEGLDAIELKRRRGVENGASDLAVIDGDAARELEPRLSPRARAALWAPSTAILSPFRLVHAVARSAHDNGVAFRFDAEVERVEAAGHGYRLWLRDGSAVHAHFVVNAAGDDAALLDAQLHDADLVVRPRRGQYYVFDKQGDEGLRRVLFQAAETDEGGTLLAPTIDGNLLAGPTSENVRAFHQTATTRAGLAHVERVARKLVPDLDMGQVIANFAGVRANIANVEKERKDFVVRCSAPRFVSALGIKNPGMTSSPALARLAVSLLAKEGLALESDPAFDARGRLGRPFMERSVAEQRELLSRDASYGRLLCRCERITEGDVRRILAEPLPPRDLDGVKRRLRTSMGRCQGAFCTSRLVELLAEEWGVEATAIRKGGPAGRVVTGAVK